MTEQTFHDLGVSEPICRALEAEGYTTPTPIQKGSIPTLLEGRDLLGLAQTGTGKTAAFSVPILQRLASGHPAKSKTPRALILAPTRELAVQINDSLRLYGRNLKLRSLAVFGGVGIGAQIDALARGIDILVATPGRLLDLTSQRCCDLSAIEILVLDEADRMLDMGFVRDVRRIVQMVPKARQTLLLSATMPTDIERLATEILRDPVRVEIAHAGKTVDRIAQSVHFVSANAKRDLLTILLADEQMSRVMVFTRTKRGADRVAQHLTRNDISAEAIHGNKSQNNRQRTLESFRSGRTRVLVATDIAARGIDIDLVTHVVNFELPHEPEAYVHRIGRTARAGTEGVAIGFCSPDERADLKAIERLTRRTLDVAETPEIVVTTSRATDARLDRIEERREARDASLALARPSRPANGGGRSRQGKNRNGEQGDRKNGSHRNAGSAHRDGANGTHRSEASKSGGRPRTEAQRPHDGGNRQGENGRRADARGSDHRASDHRGADHRGSEHRGAEHRGHSHPRGPRGASDARQSNGAGAAESRGQPRHRRSDGRKGERHAAAGAHDNGPTPWSSWTSRPGSR